MSQKSARDMALEAFHAVEHDGAYSNIALHRVLEKYGPEKADRGFITELVYGALRTLNTLDWVLSLFLKKSPEKLPPRIRNILRMGVYQLCYLERVPDAAVCNESAKLARVYGHEGTVGLVNGVLRNVARSRERIQFPDIAKDPVRGIALRHSHPEWLVRRWIDEFGPAGAEALCRANNEIPPNAVRTNTLKNSREELKQVLAGEGVATAEGRFAPETLIIGGFKSVGSLAAHRSGLFMVQDESSTMVGHAVAPVPGSFVLDACSAPGGKSTHMAQLMGNRGRIVSADIHHHKLDLIRQNAGRLGVDIIEPVLCDAAELDARFAGTADYVLVDAPCSGLGVLRRRPEIKWRRQPEQINELSELQARILQSAGKCLKPGGVLVYSTCTITREENLDVVSAFLAENRAFRPDSLSACLPAARLLADLPGSGTLPRGYVQFLPHIHGTDGFFIARMRKEEAGN